jgi:predicted alpha/beta-fold hydrolase
VIILHGLEGSSTAPLTAAFAEKFAKLGFAVAAINFRGCSGSPSKKQVSVSIQTLEYMLLSLHVTTTYGHRVYDA